MTDYIYAVMNGNGMVENIVTADNDEAVAALRLLIPEAADIILTTDASGAAYIGGDMLDGRFRMPSPFPSWVWDEQSWSWAAPIPYPEGGNGYTWDEESGSWIEIPTASLDPEDETPAP